MLKIWIYCINSDKIRVLGGFWGDAGRGGSDVGGSDAERG